MYKNSLHQGGGHIYIGGEEERKETGLMRRTEDVIQRDTEAESNVLRECNSTMHDVMNEHSLAVNYFITFIISAGFTRSTSEIVHFLQAEKE